LDSAAIARSPDPDREWNEINRKKYSQNGKESQGFILFNPGIVVHFLCVRPRLSIIPIRVVYKFLKYSNSAR
jgi:hypothetical protein